MMIYEVTTTEQAESDLRCIYEYIAFELLSPENAARQLDRLEEHIPQDLKHSRRSTEPTKKNLGRAEDFV